MDCIGSCTNTSVCLRSWILQRVQWSSLLLPRDCLSRTVLQCLCQEGLHYLPCGTRSMASIHPSALPFWSFKFAHGAPPDMSFTVTVRNRLIPVDVFIADHHNVTYMMIQAEPFRHRKRGTIYSFETETQMMNWLSIFNQVVAAIIVITNIQKIQFHDYHGSLSLMYLPHEIRPQVVLVVHNAHYNCVLPLTTHHRREFVYSSLEPYLEHNGNFDMLHVVVSYIRNFQGSHGVVAVSPRYAEQVYSIVAPSGKQLIALGFMGEDLEVSEVGFPFLTTVEVSGALVYFITFIVAGANSGW